MASGTSKESEIKLTNVARANLEELQLDYEDFLRTQKLPIWAKESIYITRLRELNKTPNANYDTFKKGIENPDPAICANVNHIVVLFRERLPQQNAVKHPLPRRVFTYS